VGRPKAGSPGRGSKAWVYGTKALLAWEGITVNRGKTYTSIHQNESNHSNEGRTVEMGITVDDDKSPIRRKSRAQYLCTSPSSICSPKDYNSLRGGSSRIYHSHYIYTIHKRNGIKARGGKRDWAKSLQEMVFYLISLAKGARPRRRAPVLAACSSMCISRGFEYVSKRRVVMTHQPKFRWLLIDYRIGEDDQPGAQEGGHSIACSLDRCMAHILW